MIRIKVHEKHTTLEDVDDAFKSQAYNLMENWCLVRVSELDEAFSYEHNPWIDELYAALFNCLKVILNIPHSQRAVLKRIDKGLNLPIISDPDKSRNLIETKFLVKEHIPEDVFNQVLKEWYTDGKAELRKVLTSEQSLVSYIRAKQATAPAKKTRKRRK